MNAETAALIALLQSTKRAQLREMAARQLADREDPDAASALLDLLQDTADSRAIPVVTAALSGLQRLGATIAPLVEQVLDSPSDARRAFMPLLLASALGTAAVPRLLDALSDPQREVRVNAATQLGLLRDERAFGPLRTIAEDEHGEAALRGVAASALGAHGDRRALPLLTQLATTEDPELLWGVIDGLANMRLPQAIPVLDAMLERPGLSERTLRAVRLALLAMERYREP